jgi:bifunctional non-homologous end joining protein LigD
VSWEEVAECRGARGLEFRAPDVVGRVERYGDLLAPLLDAERAAELP